jgi:hypothetical protein
MTLAVLGNDAANYNIGVMLHRGLGTTPDWVAALDFLKPSKQSTHYLSADSYRNRILQQALIGLGFLNGKADGDYGPATDKAVDQTLKFFADRGGFPQSIQGEIERRRGQDDWYYYAIVGVYREKNGWKPDSSNPPKKPNAGLVTIPADARKFTPISNPVPAVKQVVKGQTPTPQSKRLSPQDLYATRSKSVHMIFAADGMSSRQRLKNLSQGSAVAITPDILVTNCHVIEQKNIVILIANGVPYPARRIAGSDTRDTCFIKSEKYRLTPVYATRKSPDLKIGESVYAIGSPRGQENSLSQGILSGIRKDDGISLLQMTAPISPGSSGGGLFDEYGNLLGVTTMTLRDSQSLNFAIAIEEFSR